MRDALDELLSGLAGLLNDIKHGAFRRDSPEVVVLAAGLQDALPELLQAMHDQFGTVSLRFERGRVAFVEYERSRKARNGPR